MGHFRGSLLQACVGHFCVGPAYLDISVGRACLDISARLVFGGANMNMKRGPLGGLPYKLLPWRCETMPLTTVAINIIAATQAMLSRGKL